MKFRPLGALERPFVLGAGNESLARMADLEQDLRLLVPAIVLAVQEMVEEPQLLLAAVIRVEMRPVLAAMDFEPFLPRCGLHEAFEIPARMKTLAAPIGGGKQRRRDLVPHRRASAMISVGERMGEKTVTEISAVASERALAERLRSAYELSVHGRTLAALAGAVLHSLDLHVVPVLPERA